MIEGAGHPDPPPQVYMGLLLHTYTNHQNALPLFPTHISLMAQDQEGVLPYGQDGKEPSVGYRQR